MFRAIFIYAAIVLLALGACSTSDKEVAYVEGYPITASEMHYWMLLKKAEVNRYFYREHRVHNADNFWENEYNNESPIAMLKNLAMQEAKRCKVQQIMAFERGLVQEIHFDSITAQVGVENSRRAEKVERGEVIYGHQHFTQRSYFSHQFDNMVYLLKQELSEQELKPSLAELEQFIPSDTFMIDEYMGFLKMQYVDENYEAFVDSMANNVKIKLNKRVWNTITL